MQEAPILTADVSSTGRNIAIDDGYALEEQQGRTYRCHVIIREAEDGGFLSIVPALPSAYSQGSSPKEALERVKEAIDGIIRCYLEDGEDIAWDSGQGIDFEYEEEDIRRTVFINV